MINRLVNFFKPAILTYHYNKSKEEVRLIVEAVFSKRPTFLSSKDMDGSFIDDGQFIIKIGSVSFRNPEAISSAIHGRLEATGTHTTVIHLHFQRSFAVYFLFVMLTLTGIIGLFKGGLLMAILIVGGPAFAIWLGNIGDAVIKDRYIRYIDKELRKTV